MRLGAVFSGHTTRGVYFISRDVVNCAGGCAGLMCFFSDASQLPLVKICLVFVCQRDGRVHKVRRRSSVCSAAHLGGAHDAIDCCDGTQVYSGWFQGAWYRYVRSILFACRRSSRPQGSASEMFNVDKKHGPLHRLEARKLVEVWPQAKAHTETQQKVESAARAHRMPVELPTGSWENLMKAFQDQYGSSIPLKELPAQSYFEVLEEMVQDGVFHAGPVVSLVTDNKHRLANPESHSQHVSLLFDGSTIRPKKRSVSSMPEDLEGFRAKYEIMANVWRMMKLRSPGRAVLAGLTEHGVIAEVLCVS